EFSRDEPPGTVDYVWTSHRVVRLTRASQYLHAYRRLKVGDIIQYHNATFSNRGPLAHHTQVVAAVDRRGYVMVFEQNVGDPANRTAQRRNATTYLRTLTGGSVTIYRPVPRVKRAGQVEFTVVNNTPVSQTYQVRLPGADTETVTLTAANTTSSYRQGVWK